MKEVAGEAGSNARMRCTFQPSERAKWAWRLLGLVEVFAFRQDRRAGAMGFALTTRSGAGATESDSNLLLTVARSTAADRFLITRGAGICVGVTFLDIAGDGREEDVGDRRSLAFEIRILCASIEVPCRAAEDDDDEIADEEEGTREAGRVTGLDGADRDAIHGF